MNSSQLQTLPPSQVQRVSRDGEDRDAEFIALRLLNKRARLRLSPQPIPLEPLPSKGRLFAIANHTNCFAAAICSGGSDYSIIVSSLSELRSAFSSLTSESEIALTGKQSIQLPGTPSIVVFACNETRLLVALSQGQILVYDVQALVAGSTNTPLSILSSGFPAREISPNPEGIPELVAILYDSDGSAGTQAVEILDVQKLQVVGGWRNGGTPETTSTTLSWSPKGKQLALGLRSGDIVTFSPTDTSKIKTLIPRPSSLPSQFVLTTTWLSNPDFHTIYVPFGPLAADTEQTHLILSLDSKSNTSTEVKLNCPYLPYPGLRLPGSFEVVLKNWDPAKFLMFIGDSTSSDIGLIGCTADPSGPHQELWCNFSLEETSTPTVPLDKDMNETVLLGLELDLTGTQSFTHKTASGEDSELPPPPVMYAYASDGTLQGWHVLNTKGTPYPGMVSGTTISQTTSTSMQSQPSTEAPAQSPASTFGQPSTFGQASPFAQARSTPSAFAQTTGAGFGQTSGTTSVFGQPSQPTSTFGQPSSAPAFGQSSFGQPSSFGAVTGSGFGQSSFGSPTTSSSAFGTTPSTGGAFGAFASAGPAKFGQSAFSSNANAGPSTLAPSTSSQPLASPMTVSTSTSEEPMAAESTETDTGLGGLSLGSGESSEPDKPKSGFGATGLFGSLPPVDTADTTKPTSAFGSTNAFDSGPSRIKPASGFGAFANLGSTSSSFGSSSAFGGTFSTGDPTKPSTASPAFGSTGFATAMPSAVSSTLGPTGFGAAPQTATSSAFGQPAFGQSAFGKSSFGQSAFGQTGLTSSAPASGSAFGGTTSGSSAGFGAFAQAGPSAFGLAAKSASGDNKPVWAVGGGEAKTEKGAELPKPVLDSTVSAVSTGLGDGGSSITSASIEEQTSRPSTPPSAAVTPVPATPAAPSGNESTTPTASPFKNTGPPVTTGAFGNLTATPSGFGKLNAGFGAFGGVTNASSPFFNPPKAMTPSAFGGGGGGTSPFGGGASTSTSVFGTPSATSVFGKSPSTLSISADGSKPSFGSTTPLGTPSSAFGKPSLVSPTTTPTSKPPAATSSNAFSAFSQTGGFSAFAGGGTQPSFKDLLKTDTDASAKAKEKAKEPLLKTPTSVFAKTPTSVFSKPSPLPETKPVQRFESKGLEYEGARGDEVDEEAAEEDDETSSFLSEDWSEESIPEEQAEEEGEESQEEEEEEEPEHDQDIAGVLPSKVSTPRKSGSRSPTPKSITPSIRLTTPSPPPTTDVADKGKAPATSSEGSTTPPGSPAMRASPSPPPASPIPVVSPIPVAGGPATPFGIGLGRPSTRPTRSSPLASAPISGDDEEEEEEVRPTPSKPPPPVVDTSDKTLKAASVGLFGQILSPSPSPKDEKSPPSRPKTPPLLSKFSGPKVDEPSIAAPAAQATPKSSIFSSGLTDFGKKSPSPEPSGSKQGIFPSGFGTFGQKPSTPPPITPATPESGSKPGIFSAPFGDFGKTPSTSGGIFGLGKLPAPPTPGSVFASTPSSIPSLPAGGLFGQKPPVVTSPGAGFFGQKPSPVTGAAAEVTKQQLAPIQPTPAVKLQEGMQKECASLIESMTSELAQLGKKAEIFNTRARQVIYTSVDGAKTVSDLADPSKWGIMDLPEFGRIMMSLWKDIEELKELRIGYEKAIRELERSMLRATTKKEEIARFSKASTDTEFAKVLKNRTLEPEHLETQSHLRRQIRVLRDRIQKLEEHLQGSKKRLNQMKTGRPGLRAPTLDTINRTYRNIDLAITQQADEVARLTARIGKLNLKAVKPSLSSSTRDKRLPDDIYSPPGSGRRGPLNVTTNVAVTTAAALNAERSAQKLKKALLKVRKEPLLNMQAIDAPSIPQEFKTPMKAAEVKLDLGSSDGGGGFLNLDSLSIKLDIPATGLSSSGGIPDWKSTADILGSSSPAHNHSTLRNKRSSAKQHYPSAHRKSSGPAVPTSPIPPPAKFSWGPLPGATPTSTQPQASAPAPNSISPPAGFSWGPLPVVGQAKSLPFDLRKGGMGSLIGNGSISSPSLTESWVTEGFGVKR